MMKFAIILLFLLCCTQAHPYEKQHFPKMPALALEEDPFVLVSETNLTNRNELHLMKQDILGEPLGVDDNIPFDERINEVDDETDPSQGPHFEGDIAGIELLARDGDPSQPGVLLTYGKVKSTVTHRKERIVY